MPGWVCQIDIYPQYDQDDHTVLTVHRPDRLTAALAAVAMVLQATGPHLRDQLDRLVTLSAELGLGAPTEDGGVPGTAQVCRTCSGQGVLHRPLDTPTQPDGDTAAGQPGLDPATAERCRTAVAALLHTAKQVTRWTPEHVAKLVGQPDDTVVGAEVPEVVGAVLATLVRERAELVEALGLSVEYVGTDVLKPLPGWSWFDALSRCAPEVAGRLADDHARRTG